MSDDEIVIIEPSDPLARVYDYFKHLTTVSLIAIGGIFGLLQGNGPKLKPAATIVVLGVIALAAGISMMTTSAITFGELRGKVTEKTRTQLAILQLSTTCLLMIGLGIFVGLFSSIVK
jgi:hypothetical protein